MEKILFISPSTLDRKSLLLTSAICVLPTLIFGWMFYRSTMGSNQFPPVICGCMTALFVGIFISGVICTPHKYILTNSHLIIKRHIKDIAIPLQEIKLIRLMTTEDKKGMIRIFGAEGAYGSWGYYNTSAHKKLTVLARRYNNRTLIITDRKKYVIAPDDLQLVDIAAEQIENAEISIMEPLANNWRRWIPAIIIIATTVLLYFSYKEPRAVLDSNTFKLKGIYGANIPFAEISKVDTITWHEMPAISIRTNGISLFKVHRGYFKTHDGETVRLNVQRGISPIIRIVTNDGAEYYINRKKPDETMRIFNQLVLSQ